VLGDDMQPEFNHGDIIIIEPDGALHDGCFVLARHGDGWLLRQLRRAGDGWWLHALNPGPVDGCADQPCPTCSRCAAWSSRRPCPGRRR
jgi:DNA polymerase V